MKNIIQNTFGGLTKQYYLRHLFFGSLLPAMLIFTMFIGDGAFHYQALPILAINTLLYPYSRFVYESIVRFIVGDNVFFVNATLMLFTKTVTIILCWGFAIFVAPIGLIYLYYINNKSKTLNNNPS